MWLYYVWSIFNILEDSYIFFSCKIIITLLWYFLIAVVVYPPCVLSRCGDANRLFTQQPHNKFKEFVAVFSICYVNRRRNSKYNYWRHSWSMGEKLHDTSDIIEVARHQEHNETWQKILARTLFFLQYLQLKTQNIKTI